MTVVNRLRTGSQPKLVGNSSQTKLGTNVVTVEKQQFHAPPNRKVSTMRVQSKKIRNVVIEIEEESSFVTEIEDDSTVMKLTVEGSEPSVSDSNQSSLNTD